MQQDKNQSILLQMNGLHKIYWFALDEINSEIPAQSAP